jgi:hypothetical protein
VPEKVSGTEKEPKKPKKPKGQKKDTRKAVAKKQNVSENCAQP